MYYFFETSDVNTKNACHHASPDSDFTPQRDNRQQWQKVTTIAGQQPKQSRSRITLFICVAILQPLADPELGRRPESASE